jgi:hypothetical protein
MKSDCFRPPRGEGGVNRLDLVTIGWNSPDVGTSKPQQPSSREYPITKLGFGDRATSPLTRALERFGQLWTALERPGDFRLQTQTE